MKEIILVTGGSGLVGKAINAISDNYDEKYRFIFASSKMCNLLNYEETHHFFEELKPDYVIHLAANVGGLYKNMQRPVDMLEDNIAINSNVLKAAHNVKVKKLIACLSTCIYPDNVSYPIIEEYLHMGEPHSSNFAYAHAKRLLQVQCESYNKQYGDNFVCIIPTNIYGKYDNFNLNDSHVIPALIHKCYLAKQHNEKFIVSGTGSPLRQFIYSEDLAKMIMMILQSYDGKMIILSTTEEISIKEIAEIIAQKFDYLHNIEFDHSKADGQYKKTVSNQQFLSLYDFSFTPLSHGLNTTIEWFINNYHHTKK